MFSESVSAGRNWEGVYGSTLSQASTRGGFGIPGSASTLAKTGGLAFDRLCSACAGLLGSCLPACSPPPSPPTTHPTHPSSADITRTTATSDGEATAVGAYGRAFVRVVDSARRTGSILVNRQQNSP